MTELRSGESRILDSVSFVNIALFSPHNEYTSGLFLDIYFSDDKIESHKIEVTDQRTLRI